MLKAIAADNVEAFDEGKAKALMDEKAKLQIQLDRIADTKQKRENAKSRLDEIFVILEALANHPISYDDQIVRQILESVVVESKERIKVVFIGGLEVTQLLWLLRAPTTLTAPSYGKRRKAGRISLVLEITGYGGEVSRKKLQL